MADPVKQPFDTAKARDEAVRMLQEIVQSVDEYPVAERRQAAKALLDALGEMPSSGAEMLVLELSDEQLVDIIAREIQREQELSNAGTGDAVQGGVPGAVSGGASGSVKRGTTDPQGKTQAIVPTGTAQSPAPAAAAPAPPRPTLAALLAGVGDFSDPLADEPDPLA